MVQAPGTVQLCGQQSASAMLYGVLAEALGAFPQAFQQAEFPKDAAVFRRNYVAGLPRFEAARLASPQRAAITRHLVEATRERIEWQDERGTQPLYQALQETVAPFPLQHHAGPSSSGWRPTVLYRGRRWEAAELADLGAELVQRGVVTASAGTALEWMCDNTLKKNTLHKGELRLTGRKIVVFGGGAEMAPTRFWLEAGADVLWLDVNPPPAEWLQAGWMCGDLYWPAQGADLLTQPREVLATILAFAAGDPVDLGLYAYAPGQMRELRLTCVMNAIVDALPADLVASVTLLVSPTTPTGLAAQDIADMQARALGRPAWESLLAALGLLGRGGGCARQGQAAATRTVVSIQGASYQAAQYLGKIIMADYWAGLSEPFRVSANTAAITRTRSLDHPVFAAAFGGAAALGVETFTPRLSRRINGLLAVQDWLHPEPPVPGAVRVHGGIHTLPYPLESALRIAAAIGFVRSPRLLRALLRRR